jgi:heptosyltransferase-2
MKIIITQLGRIGDMILLTPVFSALKGKFPKSEISVLSSKHNHSVLKNNPNIDKIFIYDKKIISSLKIFYSLKFYKYHYLVDPKDHHSSESQLFARIINAKTKVGFNRANGNFNISIPRAEDFTHYTKKMFDAFSKIGLDVPSRLPRPELFEEPVSVYYVNEFLGEINSDFNLINISASKPSKMWAIENWIKFIQNSNSDIPFVITSAPSEFENAKKIVEITSNTHLFKSRSLHNVISLTKKAKLLITIDTALVHISAAWDIPLIGLFGGLETEFQKFKPLNSKYQALRNPDGIDGVAEITVDNLLEAYKIF